ncbi:MAG TPA: hypothetical protein VGG23_08055, partial [Acidimicrobiales bacterium]
MAFTVVLDVVVVVWVLYRQVQVRRVRAQVNLRLSAVLAVIGLIELISYAGHHHLSAKVVGVLVLSMLVGAGGFGAIRAATVHIWRDESGVFRQGTSLTMVLWIVSLALHFGADWWIDAWKGPSGLASVSLLLYIGITYGVQNAVVHARAQKLLAAAGPMGARSAPFAGHWWARTWTPSSRWPDGYRGEGHPGAIDARADPLFPPPGQAPATPPSPPPSGQAPPWPPPSGQAPPDPPRPPPPPPPASPPGRPD